MYEVEKLDNVTWYGHCVVHVMAALKDLPDEAKLLFCRDLERFVRRPVRTLHVVVRAQECAEPLRGVHQIDVRFLG